jgi:CRP-like cAMP-binding protein
MVKGRSNSSPDPRVNQLLASLPEFDYQRLAAQLERVPMPLGMAVYESGGAQGFVYFPADSIVSLLYVLEDGASTEIAVTGNEGLVGISLFMGGESTPSRAVVQSAGHGYRVRGAILKKLFASSGSVQQLLLRFTQALITQMT